MHRRRFRLAACGFAVVFCIQVFAVAYVLKEAGIAKPIWLILILVWAVVSVIPISRVFARWASPPLSS